MMVWPRSARCHHCVCHNPDFVLCNALVRLFIPVVFGVCSSANLLDGAFLFKLFNANVHPDSFSQRLRMSPSLGYRYLLLKIEPLVLV